ncbi:hypothetical protein ERE_35630 [Agathobacter rectalis M104/1]|jgi:sucrose-6-phosphate hydrolase SacC (GH32 family)|uniref:hypothetical protein n=1 Tax=Agathobacter rectalis TaxID=39491 RepID=UPI0001CD1589|nr:hypothetical protein [Agathobacter rectalis]CBK95298.1 hypothetical protein ERE_35630 [Agathobacter rectalis M104/1]
MKNKYLTTLILTLAITSALTGCANGPLAKKAVIQDKTIKEQIDEKRSNENQNTEIPSVKKTESEKETESEDIDKQFSQDDICTFIYRMLTKMKYITDNTTDVKDKTITAKDFSELLINEGFEYKPFDIENLTEGSVCVTDSSASLCMYVDKDKKIYTLCAYDTEENSSIKTYTKEDIEKMKFKGMFLYKAIPIQNQGE